MQQRQAAYSSYLPPDCDGDTNNMSDAYELRCLVLYYLHLVQAPPLSPSLPPPPPPPPPFPPSPITQIGSCSVHVQ